MALVVDLQRMRVDAPITDVATDPRARQSGRTPSVVQRLRARLGQQVHARYRSACEQRYGPAFRAEQTVACERTVDGFTVRLRGRIDGLVQREGVLCIEEVKSVTMPHLELRQRTADDFPNYCLQLRLYALAVLESGVETRAVELALILVSLVDESKHRISVSCDPAGTQRRLAARIRQAISETQLEQARRDMRRAVAKNLVFPYRDVRRYQDRFMTGVTAGLAAKRPVLAMAPTGLGKTVGALLPALRYALHCGLALRFLTAKRTQRQHVAETFELLREAAGTDAKPLLAISLRAKTDMCPPGHLACHPDACPYIDQYAYRSRNLDAFRGLVAAGGHIEPEQLYQLGVAHRLCPFELATDVARVAELVIGDFNHGYAELLGNASPLHRAVVILDEAHNLGERARDQLSPRIRHADIRALQLRFAAASTQAVPDPANQLKLVTDDAASSNESRGSQLARLFDDLSRLFPTTASEVPTALSSLHQQIDSLSQRAARALFELAWRDRRRGVFRRPDLIHEVLRAVVGLGDAMTKRTAQLVAHVYGTPRSEPEAIGVLCLDAARWLASRHQHAAGIVAMSATLSPLSHYRRALGFATLDPVEIDTPSPFPKARRRIIIAPSVRTAYRHRRDHYQRIATIVAAVAGARPGRYIAFFPSFAFLDQVRAVLQLPNWTTLCQTPGAAATERDRLLGQFRKTPGPTLLLAVMGGAFAEGIDLPGDALIGAFVIGPALPHVGPERDLISDYFERDEGDGFAHAFLYPGMQRVVQAAGRVIRTQHDRGIIVLLGERFSQSAYARCLPRDWYQESPAELISHDPAATAAEFWRRGERD